jgi:anti-sigma factor RsiW
MSEQSFNPKQPLAAADYEELTAYLDGELSATEMQTVEQRLAADHVYRDELQRLQKAWDVLDRLPRSESSAAFTKSTIEMVVQDAIREVRKKKQRNSSWLWRAAAIAAVPLGSFIICQNVVAYFQNAPQRQLARDLPVIENVDVYLKADNIEFLKALERTGLFDDENDYLAVEQEPVQ